MKREHRVLSLAVRRELMDLCIASITQMRQAGVRMLPKHHSWVHMTHEMWFSGNAQYHSTYEDEHDNGVVASCARGAHPLLMPFTVLQKIIVAESRDL